MAVGRRRVTAGLTWRGRRRRKGGKSEVSWAQIHSRSLEEIKARIQFSFIARVAANIALIAFIPLKERGGEGAGEGRGGCNPPQQDLHVLVSTPDSTVSGLNTTQKNELAEVDLPRLLPGWPHPGSPAPSASVGLRQPPSASVGLLSVGGRSCSSPPGLFVLECLHLLLF